LFSFFFFYPIFSISMTLISKDDKRLASPVFPVYQIARQAGVLSGLYLAP